MIHVFILCVYSVFITGLVSVDACTNVKNEWILSASDLHRDASKGTLMARFRADFYTSMSAAVIATILGQDQMDCIFKCLGKPNCVSFNIAISHDSNGLHLCELLSTDKYKAPDQLHDNGSFHYYSPWLPCGSYPCLNGGECIPLYNISSFKCICKQPFIGHYCESVCQNALGMEDYYVTDAQITASSEWNSANHAARQGRLHFKASGNLAGSWSALTNDQNQWLQVDFGTETTIYTIATQGRNAHAQWVTSYKVDYSTDGTSFQYYNENGDTTGKVCNGNSDRDTIVYNQFSPPIKSRIIRVRPHSWHGHVSMRVEFYGCSECMTPLGMESNSIKNVQVTASSEWDSAHAAHQGRLHFKEGQNVRGSWSSLPNDQNQWLQVDLCGVKKVTRFASQGRNGWDQWVTSYKLQYSNDEVSFRYYRKEGDSGDTILSGNINSDTVVYHVLIPPINARFIRVRPVSWYHHISMRIELYGC